MKLTAHLAGIAAVAFCVAGTASAHDGEFHCTNCDKWNVAQAPFKLYGNTWYVGTRELAALLVTSPQGHILLDGALPQSAPLIEANIKALGFKIKDVKLIVNSHEHFDHAGGIAALQRASGARVAASAIGARVLQDGVIGKDDAQYDPAQDPRIEKVAPVQAVSDGDVLKVGTLALTAHMTPGHAPGGTSWTWTSCEKDQCRAMVYADSLTAVSADGYRLTDHPERMAQLRATIDKVGAFTCDLIVSTHPEFTDIMVKHDAKASFLDPAGCKTYAAEARANLAARLAREHPPKK